MKRGRIGQRPLKTYAKSVKVPQIEWQSDEPKLEFDVAEFRRVVESSGRR